jgi:cyanophycinase-like exopeptidase
MSNFPRRDIFLLPEKPTDKDRIKRLLSIIRENSHHWSEVGIGIDTKTMLLRFNNEEVRKVMDGFDEGNPND